MAVAGLGDGHRWADGSVMRTFAIVTTDAIGADGELHGRMPVILEPEDWPTWLGQVEGDPAALLRPAGDDVSKSGRSTNR